MLVNWAINGGFYTAISGNTITFHDYNIDGIWATYKEPPACACGHRSDRHWSHAEDECTWVTPGDVAPQVA